MQGQRGTIGSLPEILEFSHGSTSGNPVINQPVFWNNTPNPVGNRVPNYMLAPNSDVAYLNPFNQERQNLSGWSLGEPNFSGSENGINHGVQKTEDGSFSGSSHGGAGRRSEWQCDPANDLSVGSVNSNPLFLCSSNFNGIPQNLNLNVDFVGDDHCASEFSNLNNSGGSVSEHTQITGSSDTFLPPSGSGGYLVQENDRRPNCSLDGRRASCKRKALEGSVGQSSMDGSSNYLQHTESSLWGGGSVHNNEGTSLSISSPSEQSNPRPCTRASDNVSGSMVMGSAESYRRNFRLRINPTNQQEPTPHTLPSTGNAVRYSSVSTPQQSSRPIPIDHSLDLRSASATDSAIPQSQSTVARFPPMLQNVQPFGWNEVSSSSFRAVTSATSIVSNDRNSVQPEEVRSRTRARNIQEHPMFVPASELRSRNHTSRNLTGALPNIPGNVASTATTSSSSGVHRSPHWVPHPHPPSRIARRLAEYARRTLISSIEADSEGQNNSLLHSAAPSSDERVLPSGAVSYGHHRLNSRSTSWMERQGDSAHEIPYPFRTLASASEGRNRLVISEIRNVLDLMHRGENLRFEDVVLLDQSVFFRGADLHDRYRDMRLDVDNMSYEELLALEERIGNVSTGLSEEIILSCLKQRKFSPPPVSSQQEIEPCCVCQEEYIDGEDIGTLDCGHDFHAECIKHWLTHKNLCPICKTTGLAK